MDNQRIVGRATLRGENLTHGFRIQSVSTEAVHGLGGKGDESAGTQNLRGSGDSIRSGPVGGNGDYLGQHRVDFRDTRGAQGSDERYANATQRNLFRTRGKSGKPYPLFTFRQLPEQEQSGES